MAQSESNKAEKVIAMPQRSFRIELLVGIFTMIGVLAAGYLAVGLGGLELGDSGTYAINAEFDNISGLQAGASVEIAGVPIGQVSNIALKDPMALVTLRITNEVKLRDDDVLSIRTKGIIGDRYIKVSRGGSDTYLPTQGGNVTETESVVDIEDIIGKIVHNMTSNEDSQDSAE